jgi:hypothetical protein
MIRNGREPPAQLVHRTDDECEDFLFGDMVLLEPEPPGATKHRRLIDQHNECQSVKTPNWRGIPSRVSIGVLNMGGSVSDHPETPQYQIAGKSLKNAPIFKTKHHITVSNGGQVR